MEYYRVKLEKYEQNDFHYFSSLVFNESVMNMNMGRIFTKEEAEDYFHFMINNNKKYEFAGHYKVFKECNSEFIGTATLSLNENFLSAEIEFMILPDYWGKGYGTEIASCLLEFAKKYDVIKEITAITNQNNIGSRNVLQKNGFEYQSTYKVEEEDRLADIYIKKL